MIDEYENMDNLFSRELKNHAPAPPENMWEKIEQRIPQKQNKKTPFFFYKLAASIALLLSAGSLGLYLLTHTPEHEQLITSEVIVKKNTTEIAPTIKNTETNVVVEKSFEVAPTKPSLKANSHVKNITPVNTNIETELSEPLIVASVVEQNYNEPNNSINAIESIVTTDSKKEETIIYQPEKPVYSEAYKAFLSEFESLDEETSSNYSKWSVGGQAGPQYTYRQIYSDNVSQEFLDKYNQEETGLIAYAGGLNFAYKPARRLTIQSGIYYSKMGQTTAAQPVENYRGDDVLFATPISGETLINNSNPATLRVSTSMGSIPKPAPSNTVNADITDNSAPASYENVSHVNQYIEFLEIPLLARYAIIDRKVNFHLLGGLSTNFLIASPVYLDNGDYYTEANNLNKVNYSSTVGLGLGYNFSSNFTFSIEPQFKYYINKVNSNPQTEVHPYSFGVFTGVTYLF